jgi:hypothetical protein
MTPLGTAAIAVLAFLGLYRRFRRLFGRQRIRPGWLRVRIGILLVIAAALLLRGSHAPGAALAVAAGLGAGLLLALAGLRLTRFEHTGEGDFHTPHGGIGLALSALLVGRLAWRAYVVWPTLEAAQATGAGPLALVQRNAWTNALLALLVGYYLAYSIGVLLHAARVHRPDGSEPSRLAGP